MEGIQPLGIRDMKKELQEIEAVRQALISIKAQLKAYQSNPTNIASLVAAVKAINAAAQLPLPPGASYLSAELQSAVQLGTTLGSMPVIMYSCSTSNPDAIQVFDSNGNRVTIAQLISNPTATFHFSCRLDNGQYSFKASNWALFFHPGQILGRFQSLPPSVDTATGVKGDVQSYDCHSYLDINASATGAQIASLGGTELSGAASNAITTFLNTLI